MDPLAYANTYLDDEHSMYSVAKLYKIQTIRKCWKEERKQHQHGPTEQLNMLSYQNWNLQKYVACLFIAEPPSMEKENNSRQWTKIHQRSILLFSDSGGEKKAHFLY